MEYWPVKSVEPVARVTLAVPLPVRVPGPLTTTDEAGVKLTLAAMVSVPEIIKLKLEEKPLVLFKLTVLKPIVDADVPLIEVAAAGVGALKLSTLEVVKENGVAAEVLTNQWPAKLWLSEVPAANVAVPARVKSPFTVKAPPAVLAALPLKLR